jgi:hypothetical protein
VIPRLANVLMSIAVLVDEPAAHSMRMRICASEFAG